MSLILRSVSLFSADSSLVTARLGIGFVHRTFSIDDFEDFVNLNVTGSDVRDGYLDQGMR
jgi:hypothetical protein